MSLGRMQKEVIEYLKDKKTWTRPTEIGQKVWGTRYHSASASPVCLKLVEKGILARNKKGHYKIKKKEGK